jgi:outer membrane protein assembly factor BamB
VLSASLRENVLLLGEADGTLRRRDPSSGASQWAVRAGGSSFTPAASGENGRIFLGSDGRVFLALDPRDGSREWRWRIGARAAESPAIVGRRVLFATLEDVVYALGQGNGHMAWRAELPSRPLSGPLVVGTAVVVACHGARPLESVLLALDGATGRPMGMQVTPAEARPPILAAGGRVYVPLRDRRLLALRLGPG